MYRGRFAPSPTGDLHAGSMLVALGSWLLARQSSGQWLVRIEDLDPPREIAGAAAAQMHTLERFGLQHDGAVIRQSQRAAVYREALEKLLADGRAFECHCSRAELATQAGIHRRCVATTRRPNPAIRLRVPDNCEIGFDDLVHGHVRQRVDRDVGDFVLWRADGQCAYQLAVVVDDAAQAVTDVVRGADLLDSTPRQILLQHALGLATPTYAHLPLLLDSTGRKLSKSEAAQTLAAVNVLQALQALWRCLGQAPMAQASTETPDGFLEAATRNFQPCQIPRHCLPASAAVHNAAATSRD
ncbi:MAG: tRNA glutamyl-Q(34) synthetase GluQRS [Pseudomonadota bacterium]|nr:tRNA glutamyl-Q(34) synthetase GluQRS [Pseudomonadota bacterium]MDQ3160492.1 tRNA glutamyl-Q(34) synthetase GluQRS [Pseudomonadota bacterium]